MDATTATLVGILVMALIAVGAWALWRQRSGSKLRKQFGPEYDEAVRRHGDRKRAEEDLVQRRQRVAKLDIRSLPAQERERFARDWKTTQARFVDAPGASVREAERLVVGLMKAMGYPMGDFEQRAADVSVDHPQVVAHYRVARVIAQANERGEATTEDLREAMVRYRALFDDLLQGTGSRKEEEVHA